ncbi:FAD-dependent oxidoreductase [Allorhodopirellula solitaria]|uniref:Gamma-glutamylputrescine oxidoreductase n=1 Tax=Allorhodopirellula solitaria TaxID=2527987 RepID=A0A5C5X2L1_9BACT|nr:FAD-dependent oxidoreductase [Allorhodopirellula solitaria]TWT56491.1 Gamma-glutamylputrescine oxidoreductase [Allorhodopirellula solitaria]
MLVIGAGIAGLSTALELLQRGKRVIVCEATTIGAGTTGGSSAHLDAHPEAGTVEVISKLGVEQAAAYTKLRMQAIDVIERRVSSSCGFQRVPAYFYTEDPAHEKDMRDAFHAAKELGLDVSWCDAVPIASAACGYEISNMGRIDVLQYLHELAEAVEAAGGVIFENTLVSGPVEKHPTELETTSTCTVESDRINGQVKFEHVVCAVHCNYSSVQRLYLQTPAYQSYMIAARVREPIPDALFWDDSDPYYYTRRATNDGLTILAGGCDHRTGAGDEEASMAALQNWVQERFHVEEIVSQWSAEFFEPTDGLPFIGELPGLENAWIATGFSGMGLTLGTAAGWIIADLIDRKKVGLADAFSPGRLGLSSLGQLVSEGTTTALDYVERVVPQSAVDADSLEPGEGAVGSCDGAQVAICRDRSGCVHRLNPVCTHMGGVVRWNPVEQTWDCPVHGGRFAADGSRIYGPPESGLENAQE